MTLSHTHTHLNVNLPQFEAMVATWQKKRCADAFPPSFGWDADDYEAYLYTDLNPAHSEATCEALSHALEHQADRRLLSAEVDGDGENKPVAAGAGSERRGRGEEEVWTWATIIEDGLVKGGAKVGTTIRAYAIDNSLLQMLSQVR